MCGFSYAHTQTFNLPKLTNLLQFDQLQMSRLFSSLLSSAHSVQLSSKEKERRDILKNQSNCLKPVILNYWLVQDQLLSVYNNQPHKICFPPPSLHFSASAGSALFSDPPLGQPIGRDSN